MSFSSRMLHEVGGLETRDVFDGAGEKRRDAWLLPGGVLVRTVVALRWCWLALTGRFRGVLIRERGQTLAPVVLLDWETYSRMLIGLRPEVLKSILPEMGERSEHEDGGMYS